MKAKVKAGFEFDAIKLPLTSIHPIRQLRPSDKAWGKYHAIISSIKEVGLIEPLVVYTLMLFLVGQLCARDIAATDGMLRGQPLGNNHPSTGHLMQSELKNRLSDANSDGRPGFCTGCCAASRAAYF